LILFKETGELKGMLEVWAN